MVPRPATVARRPERVHRPREADRRRPGSHARRGKRVAAEGRSTRRWGMDAIRGADLKPGSPHPARTIGRHTHRRGAAQRCGYRACESECSGLVASHACPCLRTVRRVAADLTRWRMPRRTSTTTSGSSRRPRQRRGRSSADRDSRRPFECPAEGFHGTSAGADPGALAAASQPRPPVGGAAGESIRPTRDAATSGRPRRRGSTAPVTDFRQTMAARSHLSRVTPHRVEAPEAALLPPHQSVLAPALAIAICRRADGAGPPGRAGMGPCRLWLTC